MAVIKFGGARANRQTAKLNSLPNFPAIRYVLISQYSPLHLYCTKKSKKKGKKKKKKNKKKEKKEKEKKKKVKKKK